MTWLMHGTILMLIKLNNLSNEQGCIIDIGRVYGVIKSS